MRFTVSNIFCIIILFLFELCAFICRWYVACCMLNNCDIQMYILKNSQDFRTLTDCVQWVNVLHCMFQNWQSIQIRAGEKELIVHLELHHFCIWSIIAEKNSEPANAVHSFFLQYQNRHTLLNAQEKPLIFLWSLFKIYIYY